MIHSLLQKTLSISSSLSSSSSSARNCHLLVVGTSFKAADYSFYGNQYRHLSGGRRQDNNTGRLGHEDRGSRGGPNVGKGSVSGRREGVERGSSNVGGGRRHTFQPGRGRGRAARGDDGLHYSRGIGGRSSADGRGGRHIKSTRDNGPPTVEKLGMKTITVAATKKAKGGKEKYCYGCGAKIVKRSEVNIHTEEAGVKVRDKNSDGSGGNVQMGLKASKGGFWNERRHEVEISKIKNWTLCSRCKDLQKTSSTGMIDARQLKALSPSHEMTKIFREQVSKIRSKPNVVVILCCDSVNPRGSLINGIRNYIGGNPILLAVTRCDLLPEYLTEAWSVERQDQMKKFYIQQAKELNPADVYLCSVDNEFEEDKFDGSQQLSSDLLKHLNGRDVYVIGSANIGKSTLTDRLIDNIIKKHQQSKEAPPKAYTKRKERYVKNSENRLDEKRYEAIRDARVTKSSLPGTTLNNVRIPCFADHTQALWDTPGLILDQSLKHYPIKDFKSIKAMKPNKIQPHWHNSGERKSFALLVYENSEQGSADDAIPLLRIDVRLRKQKQQNHDPEVAPVQLVWTSNLNSILSTSISSIDEAHTAEKRREKQAQDAADKTKEEARVDEIKSVKRTPEERVKQKKVKREAWLENKKKQIAELGKETWEAMQQQKDDDLHLQRQLKKLATLTLVRKDKIKAGKPSEILIEHVGTLGVLSPSAGALVLVYAPSSGVVPSCHDMMVVPSRWEDYVGIDDESDEEEDRDESYEWVDDEFVSEQRNGGKEEEGWESFDFDSWKDTMTDYASFEPLEMDHGGIVSFHDDTDDIWGEYKGESIGWKFEHKPQYVRGKLIDGWRPVVGVDKR